MSIPPRYKPTGTIRFRRGWFNRLVPQVEVAVCRGRVPPPPGKEPPKDEILYYKWMDADKEDRDKLLRFLYKPQPFSI